MVAGISKGGMWQWMDFDGKNKKGLAKTDVDDIVEVRRAGMVCREYLCRDIAQLGLARLTGGQKVASSNLAIPTIFFARNSGKKMKPSGFASCTAGALHGTTCRFIRRSRAS